MASASDKTKDLALLYQACSSIAPLYLQISQLVPSIADDSKQSWKAFSDICLEDLEKLFELWKFKKLEISYGIPLDVNSQFLSDMQWIDHWLDKLAKYASSSWALKSRMIPTLLRVEQRLENSLVTLASEYPFDQDFLTDFRAHLHKRVIFLRQLRQNYLHTRNLMARSFILSQRLWWQKGFRNSVSKHSSVIQGESLIIYAGVNPELQKIAEEWNQKWHQELAESYVEVDSESHPIIHFVESTPEMFSDLSNYEMNILGRSALNSRTLTFHGFSSEKELDKKEKQRLEVLDQEIGVSEAFFNGPQVEDEVKGWFTDFFEDFFSVGSVQQSLGEVCKAIQSKHWQQANFLICSLIEKRIRLDRYGIGIFNGLYLHSDCATSLKKLLRYQLSHDQKSRWVLYASAVFYGCQGKGDFAYEIFLRLGNDGDFHFERLRKMLEIELCLGKASQSEQLIQHGLEKYPFRKNTWKVSQWKCQLIKQQDFIKALKDLGGVSTSFHILGFLIDRADGLLTQRKFKDAQTVLDYLSESEKLPPRILVFIFFNRVVLNVLNLKFHEAKKIFAQLEEMNLEEDLRLEVQRLKTFIGELRKTNENSVQKIQSLMAASKISLKFMRASRVNDSQLLGDGEI